MSPVAKIGTVACALFITGCASAPRVVPVSPLSFQQTAAAQGKINLEIKKGLGVVEFVPGSTSLDPSWSALKANNKQGESTPKYVSRGNVFAAYRESIENAVKGAGYEISRDGKPVTVVLGAVMCEFGERDAKPTKGAEGGSTVNTGTQPSTVTCRGKQPCTSIISVFQALEQTDGVQQTVARDCGCGGSESEESYGVAMQGALKKTQDAFIEFLSQKMK